MTKKNSGRYKNLTNYGDSEFSIFLRKAFIKGMGYSEEMLNKPIIGITNTYSDYNPCHGNVPDLIKSVKAGILSSGAIPLEFPTISIHESFAYPTSMYLRNLMSIDTEEMMKAQPMDACVLIGGCDKTVPAQLMGAFSANIPAIQLVTGPMLTGSHRGDRVGACTDCRGYWAKFRAEEIDLVEINEVKHLSEKWFGPIDRREHFTRNIPNEPLQTKARNLKVERDVPVDVIYKAFHMCARTHEDFFATDLISDILSRGHSSRLNNTLVKEQRLFTNIDAFVGGSIDNGLFYFAGKLAPNITMQQAEKGIDTEIEKLKTNMVSDSELRKVKNKVISAHMFSELNVLNKAMNLATSELIGDANLVNKQIALYEAVTKDEIQTIAQGVFRKENSNTIYYHAK